jgi:hypothetical protein
VHALAGDGAVHFVSEKIHPLVWTSLGTCKRWNNADLRNAVYDYFDGTGVWLPGSESGRWTEVQAGWDE